MLPTNPTLSPPEHDGQPNTVALPVSVLSLDSAWYEIHVPGGVGVGVPVGAGVGVALELGVPDGVGVAVGAGHPGVIVGVTLGPPPFTVTQAENSDVLPFGSVAVAVITWPD